MPDSVNTIPLSYTISKVIFVYKFCAAYRIQIHSSSINLKIIRMPIDFLSSLDYTIIVKLNTPWAVVQIIFIKICTIDKFTGGLYEYDSYKELETVSVIRRFRNDGSNVYIVSKKQ